jgi:PAS domain S-box-containing protein
MAERHRGDEVPSQAGWAESRPAALPSRVAPGERDRRFLEAIVASSDDAIIGKDPGGIIRSWNRGAEQIYGYPAEEVIGKPISILIPPEAPGDVPRILERLHRGEGLAHHETVGVARDGRRLDVSLSIRPILDSAGSLIGATAVARDITARKRTEAYGRLLAGAGEALSATLRPDAVLERLADLVVDAVADYCVTYAGAEGAEIRRVGFAHADPQRAHLLLELERSDPLSDSRHSVRRVISEGRTILLPRITDEEIEAYARNEDHLRAIRALGTRSTVVIPLRTRGRTIGGLAAGTVEGGKRPFRQMDLPRLAELADLAGLAVDNARLQADSLEKIERLQGASAELEATVAELERSRKDLEASEGRMQVAMDSAGVGTWEWTFSSDSVHWSDTLERIHGLDPGTFSGTFEGFQRDVHPEDRDRVLAEVENALSGPSSAYDVEYRIVRPDGEVRWLAARGRVLRDEAGEPVRMVGACLDITGRRKEEERGRFLARASPILAGSLDYETTLRSVADLTVPGIADWCVVNLVEDDQIRAVAVAHSDPRHRTALEELMRRNAPSLDAEVGTGAVIRTGDPLFLPEVTDEALEGTARDDEDRRLLRTIQLRSVIIVPLEARGSRFGSLTLAQSGSGRRFDESDFSLASELAKRVSLAVDNARLLRRSEINTRRLELERSRLAQIFERAPAFIAVVRGPDHVFESANPQYRELVGHRDIVGKPVREALPEVEGQGYFELLDRVYRTGEPYSATGARIEVRGLPEAPAQERFVSFVYEPLRDPDGSVSGIFIHGVDVTELVRLRNEAQAAVRSRDEMLAVVTHDLRQPIGLLQTVTHVLSEVDLPADKRRGLLERGLRASQQADRLIDDLMDVARSDLGRLELKPETVRLASLVEAVVEAFRGEAEDQGVELRGELPDDLPPVHADLDRIQRVLGNLVTNAIKHTSRGGTVKVGGRAEGDAVVCFVADTGRGIPEDEQRRVFERYSAPQWLDGAVVGRVWSFRERTGKRTYISASEDLLGVFEIAN